MNYEMCNRQMMTGLRIFQQAKQGRETKIFFVEVQEGEKHVPRAESATTRRHKNTSCLWYLFPQVHGGGQYFYRPHQRMINSREPSSQLFTNLAQSTQTECMM